MTLELTIQAMFDKYPGLFKERSDCLDQLFICIGNGYKWINGELVSNDEAYTKANKKELESHLVNNKAFQHNKLSLRAECEYYRNMRIAEGKPDLFTDIYTPEELEAMHQKHLLSLPDDVYHKQPRRERWYCYRKDKDGNEDVYLSKEYMKLYNYPKDIKSDWLAGIEETKQLLREDLSDLLKDEEI